MSEFNNTNPYRRAPRPGAGRHAAPYSGGMVSPQEYSAYSRANYGRSALPSKAKRKQKQRRGWNVVLVVAATVLVVCLAVLGVIVYGYWSGTKTYDEISQEAFALKESEALEAMAVDWDVLREKNPDVVGWIYMPGTSVDYPIVQGSTDEEYLQKDFAGEEGLIVSKGAIFLSVVNAPDFSDRNNFVYGHNMNDDTMFAHILQMADQKLFDEARTFFILTPERNFRCKTMALDIVEATETDLIRTNFESDAAFASYIEERVSHSVVDPGDEVESAEVSKLFTLITCGDDYAATRAVLTGGVVEEAVPVGAAGFEG